MARFIKRRTKWQSRIVYLKLATAAFMARRLSRDNVSQKRIGVAQFDIARNQFAFIPDNNDLVLSAADQASLVAILNALSK